MCRTCCPDMFTPDGKSAVQWEEDEETPAPVVLEFPDVPAEECLSPDGETHPCNCPCIYGKVWTKEREERIQEMFKEYGVVEGTFCPRCDLVIEFDRDPSFHGSAEDPTKCIRLYPFCTNHDVKVDWRARALAAEEKLRKIQAS